MDMSKIGLVGAVLSLAALPMAASAAVPHETAASSTRFSDAQLRARAEGVELIQARWRHHHHWGMATTGLITGAGATTIATITIGADDG